jgi:hypothetical protein
MKRKLKLAMIAIILGLLSAVAADILVPNNGKH